VSSDEEYAGSCGDTSIAKNIRAGCRAAAYPEAVERESREGNFGSESELVAEQESD